MHSKAFFNCSLVLSLSTVIIMFSVPTSCKTIFEFTRKLDTCDVQQDHPVPTGSAKVVWAYSDSVPADENSVAYHQDTRGQTGIRFRNSGDVPLPADVTTFNLTVKNTTIPFTTDPVTCYFCSVYALPTVAESAGGNPIIPTQIIKWEPAIQPENIDVIHHMLSFECPMDFDINFANWQGDCNMNVPYAVQQCQQGNVFSAWAVGGLPYSFPSNVGLPMNNNTTRYVMLETHYNNQQQRVIVDNSGMRFYRTRTLREFDGGLLGVGMPTMPNFFIPPKSPATTFVSYCISNCTQTLFPPQGVTIVGTILHSHLAGQSLSLRHVRNGFEFAPIAEEPFYDFNFQDIDIVYPPRVVLPGDLLIMTCTYSTMDRTQNTVFGLSTYNEMCLSYSVYYPRVPFTYCNSGNFSAYPVIPPTQWSPPNDTICMCADTAYFESRTDFHLEVTTPYVDNCTHVAPDPSRTTPVALSTEPDLTGYQNHQVMDSNNKYNLHWSVNLPTNEIMFAVEVEADGWVGLGLSENGGMVGSDVSIGYIGMDGSANHLDRMAVQHALPPPDYLQDYYDIRGYNSIRSNIVSSSAAPAVSSSSATVSSSSDATPSSSAAAAASSSVPEPSSSAPLSSAAPIPPLTSSSAASTGVASTGSSDGSTADESTGGGTAASSSGDDGSTGVSDDSKPIMTTARIIGVSLAGALACGLTTIFCIRRRRAADRDTADQFASLNTTSDTRATTKHVESSTGGGSYYAVPDAEEDEQHQTTQAQPSRNGHSSNGKQQQQRNGGKQQQQESPRDTYEETQYRDEYPTEEAAPHDDNHHHDDEHGDDEHHGHSHSHGGHGGHGHSHGGRGGGDDEEEHNHYSEEDQEDEQEQRRQQQRRQQQQHQSASSSRASKTKRPSRPSHNDDY